MLRSITIQVQVEVPLNWRFRWPTTGLDAHTMIIATFDGAGDLIELSGMENAELMALLDDALAEDSPLRTLIVR